MDEQLQQAMADTGYRATLPANEEERLDALYSYHILDTAEEKDFDDLALLASAICEVPVALVSFVDKNRQWFKSHKGVPDTETPIEQSFCAHTIAAPGSIMIVPDTSKDGRFADNPLVTGGPRIAFYAGVPLVNEEGYALGTLCIIDDKVRELTPAQVTALMILGRQVMDRLELRRKVLKLDVLNRNLLNSEDRFRQLIDQAPVAIGILKGRELRIESANDRILEIWGKDKSVIGKLLHIALPELEGQPFLQILDDVYTGGKAFFGSEAKVSLAHAGTLKDCFINFVYQPIKESDGTSSIMVIATEVTEQVNARIAVSDANQRLELALDAGSLGSYDVELATGIMFCTEQFKKNFGIAKDAVFNFPDLLNCILPDYRNYVLEQVDLAIETKGTYHADYQVQWPDSSVHWISAHGKARYDESGTATHMVGVTLDITATKAYDQRKDDFLGIASHELKTPITSLKAALQLLDLIKDKPSSEMHVKLIEQANKSMRKMSDLVDDLLNANRMSGGELSLNKTTFTIAHMLNSCCNHVRIEGKYDLIIIGDRNLEITADEHRIDQVVVNFVNNAVKYAPASKIIEMIVEKTGGYTKVTVKDKGPGIAPDKIPHLFDRYYQAEQSLLQYNGLGLGLYISAEIIKRHGGKIGVDSELGKGSSFWFMLPMPKDQV